MANKDQNFKVALAVLSFDRPTITLSCLAAIKEAQETQRIPDTIQTFVLHNGSKKESIASVKNQFPDVTHLELPQNCGYAGGTNALLQTVFASYEWALFLSNDCQILNFPAIPAAPSLTGPLVYRRKAGQIDSLGALFSPFRGRLKHCRSQKEFLRTRSLWTTYIPGSAFLIHRDVFKSVGGFDEMLFTYWEDVDFSVKVKKMGFPLQIQPDWKVLHGVGKTCHGKSLYSVYYFQRNRRIVSQRYAPAWMRPFNRYLLNRSQRALQRKLRSLGRTEDAGLMNQILEA